MYVLRVSGKQGDRLPLYRRGNDDPPPPRMRELRQTLYDVRDDRDNARPRDQVERQRQAFDVGKIKGGIVKACEKRPVPMYKIDRLVDSIQKEIYNSMDQEISSKQIGEMVMDGLKSIDEVAYIRYASVYRSFKDVSAFMQELESLMKKEEEKNK